MHFLQSKLLQAFHELSEGDDDDDDDDDSNEVGWSKDDIEMFQNSLLLLEEKMELLADLQQKAEKCRWSLFVFCCCDDDSTVWWQWTYNWLRLLENQLENLGSQMNCVAKASWQWTCFDEKEKYEANQMHSEDH